MESPSDMQREPAFGEGRCGLGGQLVWCNADCPRLDYIFPMPTRTIIMERRRAHERDTMDDTYLLLSPASRLGLMWQLALDAWAFAHPHEPEPRLSRRAVVLQRRAR
jgi:hypothetical protein